MSAAALRRLIRVNGIELCIQTNAVVAYVVEDERPFALGRRRLPLPGIGHDVPLPATWDELPPAVLEHTGVRE